MPPKGSKRGAAGAAAAPKKKAKVADASPEELAVAKCAEGLLQAQLTENVREMFVAMLPTSLGVPKDKRHETQSAVVGMIEEIFKGVDTRLAGDVEEAQAQVAAAAKDKEAKEAERQTLDERYADQLKEIDERKAALTSCTEATKGAEAALAAAKTEQTASAAQVEAASGTKQKCETTITELLRKLTEGEWEQKTEATQLCAELIDGGKELSFDKSLLNGMPAAAEKKPAERGCFDNMLLDQYQKHLAAAIKSLDERMASAGTLAAEHEAKVSAAEGELQAKRDAETEARGNLEAAEAQGVSLNGELQAARKEEKACGPKGQKTHQNFKMAEIDLEHFRKEYLSVFEELRDREELKPAMEVIEAEVPSVAEAVLAA